MKNHNKTKIDYLRSKHRDFPCKRLIKRIIKNEKGRREILGCDEGLTPGRQNKDVELVGRIQA